MFYNLRVWLDRFFLSVRESRLFGHIFIITYGMSCVHAFPAFYRRGGATFVTSCLAP